jgi:hypothetical protein
MIPVADGDLGRIMGHDVLSLRSMYRNGVVFTEPDFELSRRPRTFGASGGVRPFGRTGDGGFFAAVRVDRPHHFAGKCLIAVLAPGEHIWEQAPRRMTPSRGFVTRGSTALGDDNAPAVGRRSVYGRANLLNENSYDSRNAGPVHFIYDENRSDRKEMSKPVKLLLACVLCLGVIIVAGLLIQAYT